MKKALDNQIGGSHYKNMPFQPVELFAKTRCTAFQANIWKYISRYKSKNGREDIEKCIHYATLAKELNCDGQLGAKQIQLVHIFCRMNKLPEREAQIVIAAGFDNYDYVIIVCNQILQQDYAIKQ